MKRRELLKGAGAAGATAAMGGLSLVAFSGGASAKIDNLGIDGDEATTDDGSISDITVSVDGDAHYDGVDEDVSLVRIRLLANDGEGTLEEVLRQDWQVSETGSLGTSAGSFRDADIGSASLLSNTSWSASDFEAGSDGSTNEQTVNYHLQMKLFSNGSEVMSAKVKSDVTYTVNNQQSEARTGGSGSSSIDGENQSA